jgi:predicted nucleotidyltransferase
MNNHDFGLKAGDLEQIIGVISQFSVAEAIIFGSRAKGTYKNGSDIDLALKGECLDNTIVRQISYQLNEELNLPYMFDVLNYHTLTNPALIEHIDRVGKSIYTA